MCARAYSLRVYVDNWLKDEIALQSTSSSSSTEVDSRDLKRLQLSSIEWNHLKLVIDMLQNFKEATSALSQT